MTTQATAAAGSRANASLRGAWFGRIVPALVLAAAVFAAFAPALSAGFVSWDDDRNFELNRDWRGLGASELWWMLTTFHMGHYQPLSWITLGADYELWGMHAPGFHMTNVALHALTAVAFFFLARALIRAASGTDSPLAAFAAALVFAIHPLRVESVAWITERRDVLSGLFFVLALAAWVRYAADDRRASYWTAFGLVVLSLGAKAAAIVMPALLLILDVWPLRRTSLGWPRLLLEKVPFLLASVVFGVLAILAQASQPTTLLAIESHGLASRLAQAAYGLVFYAWRTLVPRDLIPLYEIPPTIDVASTRFLVPIVLVIVVAVVLVALRRRAPVLLVAALAYAVILSPVSGIAQAGPQLVADRYSYLACMPFALLAGCGAAWVLSYRPALRALVLAVIVVAGAGLGLLTFRQTHHWHDSEALWRRTVDVDPRSSHGLMNLGSVLLWRGAMSADPSQRERAFAEAESLFDRGLALRPDPQMHVNLGLIASLRAHSDATNRTALVARALEHTARGVDLGERTGWVKPDWRLAQGSALLQAGRCDEAVAVLERVELELPRTEALRRSLSLAYDCAGRKADALAQLRIALELEPHAAVLWLRAGALEMHLGNADRARAAYQRALDLRSAQVGPGAAQDPEWQQARRALDELP